MIGAINLLIIGIFFIVIAIVLKNKDKIKNELVHNKKIQILQQKYKAPKSDESKQMFLIIIGRIFVFVLIIGALIMFFNFTNVLINDVNSAVSTDNDIMIEENISVLVKSGIIIVLGFPVLSWIIKVNNNISRRY